MITRRRALTGALALPFVMKSQFGHAQDRVLRIAYTAVSHWAGAFVAQEEGFFAKRGIRAEFTLTPVSSQIPAVLLSRSADIGCLTPPTLFQAIEAGLPIRAIAGATETGNEAQSTAQAVVRADSGITTASDFVGKRVAIPGIGSVLDVVFRAWLVKNGVDLSDVTFSETSMPNLPDVLRGGTVDAVVVAEPFLSRMASSGIGTSIDFIREAVPTGTSMTLYGAAVPFAQEEPELLANFQKALQEAYDFVADEANHEAVDAHVAKYLKLPPNASAGAISPMDAELNEEQIAVWHDILTQQGLVKSPMSHSDVVIPLPSN